MEAEENDKHAGFRPKKGTREGIFNRRVVIERYQEVQKCMCVCFIDYEKAFDRVYHQKIMECLDKLEIKRNEKRIIQNLYWNQSAVVSLDNSLSGRFPIKRGVCQGCVMFETCLLCLETLYLLSEKNGFKHRFTYNLNEIFIKKILV